MKYDSVTDAGRGIERTNERVFETPEDGKTAARAVSLAAHFLLSLTAGVALAWVVAFVVPAFSGLLAATVVGFAVLWLIPWFVVTGVVRILEAVE